MKVTAWVWTLPHDYPGVDPNDMNLPISRALFKSHDGPNWLRSPGELLGLHNIYHAQGIDFGLWCVVWGAAPAGEAAMVVRALQAAQTDLMVLDIEPYAQFWRPAPWANLHPYMQAIRATLPQAKIGLSFDPRRVPYNHVVEIHFDEWLPYVDSLWPQVYWDTFGLADPGPLLEDVASYCLPTGKELVWVLPGHDPDPGRFRGGLRTALILGGGISIWRRGVTTRDNWDIIAQEGGGPPPSPEPPQHGEDSLDEYITFMGQPARVAYLTGDPIHVEEKEMTYREYIALDALGLIVRGVPDHKHGRRGQGVWRG